MAEGLAGERDVDPADLFEALRGEGGSLAAEILRRSVGRNPAGATE